MIANEKRLREMSVRLIEALPKYADDKVGQMRVIDAIRRCHHIDRPEKPLPLPKPASDPIPANAVWVNVYYHGFSVGSTLFLNRQAAENFAEHYRRTSPINDVKVEGRKRQSYLKRIL